MRESWQPCLNTKDYIHRAGSITLRIGLLTIGTLQPDNVIGAGTLNMFKNSLDRLWSKQDLLYNYRASIEKSNYVY